MPEAENLSGSQRKQHICPILHILQTGESNVATTATTLHIVSAERRRRYRRRVKSVGRGVVWSGGVASSKKGGDRRPSVIQGREPCSIKVSRIDSTAATNDDFFAASSP